jgi:hypothetical protein
MVGCRGLSSNQSSAMFVGKVQGFSLRGSVGIREEKEFYFKDTY